MKNKEHSTLQVDIGPNLRGVPAKVQILTHVCICVEEA
jgi:hypothetical protein